MENIESFYSIFEKAEEKKGGYEELLSQLPVLLSDAELNSFSDAFYLERLTACIFSSGFSKKVIQNKWDGFMSVFQEFDVDKLISLEEEAWQAMEQDVRIVRNRRKIHAVKDNVNLIKEMSKGSNGFGCFLTSWGKEDQIGLMKLLNQKGSQIGDNTSQYFLRYVGVDGFIMSSDVCAAAIEAGVMTSLKPSAQKDKLAIQKAFNFWHEESKMPYTHISKVLAFSQG